MDVVFENLCVIVDWKRQSTKVVGALKKVTVLVAASFLVGTVISAGCGGGVNNSSTLKYIDTHVHLRANSPDQYEQAASSALTTLDELGIVQSLILPPPRSADKYAAGDYEPLAAVAKAHQIGRAHV